MTSDCKRLVPAHLTANWFWVTSSTLLSKHIKIKIYRTATLPVVLSGCKNWSLTLREGVGLQVFVNRVLRRIFGTKRDEVIV